KKIKEELDMIKFYLKNYDESNYEPKIIELWQFIKERAAKVQLENMPINAIKTFEKGLPLKQLDRAGYKNIYEISNYTPIQFLQINGVGAKSASQLKEAVEKVKQSVHIRVNGRIDPDSLERLDYDLLRTIYHKRHLSVEAEKVENLITSFNEEFKEDFSIIEQQKNVFMRIFQSAKEKENIASTIDRV